MSESILELLKQRTSGSTEMVDQHWKPSRKPEPVRAMPGSSQKVDALAKRLQEGADLWCEEDGVAGDDE